MAVFPVHKKTRVEEEIILWMFLSLSPVRQKQMLMVMDFFADAMVFGKTDINFPFSFRSIEEWKKLFKEYGYAFRKLLVLGFAADKVTRNCQAWLVFDREK
ncbi:hypothetical protein HY214_03880 [Candidatus Roizmanbacteria bacterium]|nr:hypothetical protein [Candidatus Roizmanbacteria bacterium]